MCSRLAAIVKILQPRRLWLNAGRKKKKKRPKIIFFFLKKSKLPYKIFFLHISSTYAKILGETNFQPREIPRSGLKAKDGEKKERKRDRKLVITMAPKMIVSFLFYILSFPIPNHYYMFPAHTVSQSETIVHTKEY